MQTLTLNAQGRNRAELAQALKDAAAQLEHGTRDQGQVTIGPVGHGDWVVMEAQPLTPTQRLDAYAEPAPNAPSWARVSPAHHLAQLL